MTRFMNILWLEMRNYRRHFLRNVLMSFFIVLAVFLINLFASNFRYCEYLNNLVKSVGLYEDYLYVGYPNKYLYAFMDGVDYDETMVKTYVTDELEQLKQDGDIESYTGIALFQTGDGTECVMTTVELLQNLSYPVEKGHWFSRKECDQEGPVPVVIGSDLVGEYKIGEPFFCSLIGCEAEVIGVLKKNAKFLMANIGGNAMDLNSFSISCDHLMVIGTWTDDEYRTESPMFVKLTSMEHAASVFNAIADIVDTFSFKDMADKAYSDNLYLVRMQGILAFFAIIVCVTCIGCGNMLASSDNRNCQAVYNLCGMEEKMGKALVVTDCIVKLYIPAIIGLIVFYRYCEGNPSELVYVDFWNGFMTMVIITITMIFTSVKPLMKVMTASPVDIIQE